MSSTPPAAAGDARVAHGLSRPTLTDAWLALRHALGGQARQVWNELLLQARLTGDERDPAALDAFVAAARACDNRLAALCACSLAVRATAFDHLTGA